LPAQAWRNRGQSSPSAALETTLWAAAGGDVTTMKTLLMLDGVARTQATELHARLSDETRSLYPTIEDLVAACTVKMIPAGEAQLVWQQNSGADVAVACIVLNDLATPAASSASLPRIRNEKDPPTQPSKKKLSSAYLSLRRTTNGWQLVVPPSAIEKIAKELRAPSLP
jgi:hypothetical protein